MSFDRYPFIPKAAPKPQPAKPFDRYAFLWKPKA
jgi:hypothetical protein